MRKFLALLKKEIKELVTLQMIIPLLIGVLFFVFIGKVVGNENKKSNAPQNIIICDLDKSSTSKSIIDALSKGNFNVETPADENLDAVIENAKSRKIPVVITIPKGLEKGIQDLKPQQIDTYSIISNFSVTSSSSTRAVNSALAAINSYMSDQLIARKASVSNPQDLKTPIKSNDFVIVGDKKAAISPDQVTGFITSQTAFIPIIMFLIILMAAQMIAVAIASEKENKTLETLLSTPISRAALVSAKMMAAGIVSLLMAAVYMLGFRYYMNGIIGDAASGASNPQMSEAIKQLGLSLNTAGYTLLGCTLFLSILIALAISTILGAFAEDVKKVQGLISPIMFLIMIPYLLSMFMDINSAAPLLKYFVYAIPFSHPFLAAPNLFLHRVDIILYGIAYQAVIFIIFVVIAARIFSSDKILTMKLNFNKKGLRFGK